MKQLAKGLMIVGTVLAAGTACANGFEDVSPVIGLDGTWTWMNSTGEGKHIFPKNYWGLSPYVGVRWCDFGLEVGYDGYFRRDRKTTFAAGTVDPIEGATVPAGDSWRVKGKGRANGWHADLLGYLNLDECFDLIGTIGIGWKKPHLSVTYTDSANRTASFNFKGKNRASFRLGAGAQWMATDCIGLRLLGRWENTGSHKVSDATVSSTIPAIPNGTVVDTGGKAFKDAFSIVFGAFVKF